MTAGGDPREAERVRALWTPTLGATAADGGWQALPPHVTYRPPPTQSDVVPSTLRDATLSGVVTQAEAQGLR